MRKNLAIWEKQNNIKAKDVASKLGITEQTYCNIKSGKSNPSIELAYKFIEVFGDCNVLNLFKKEGE